MHDVYEYFWMMLSSNTYICLEGFRVIGLGNPQELSTGHPARPR
jgi:hypothetical protein